MPASKNIRLRKQPSQVRSQLMVQDILEAANLVLQESGLAAFNTNRVAERAGISIGSLYQYFPNKESLLLQMQSAETVDTWSKLNSILDDRTISPKERLTKAISLFFESEAKEYRLRQGLQQSEVYFDKMQEYQQLESTVTKRLEAFLVEILSPSADIASLALMIFTVTTGMASRVTQQPTDLETLKNWSNRCSEMLCGYLDI